ncbi:metallophosphoesterase family protein [Couchioplanes caeruleus]|uniref:Alkaline phosphatase n=2 Tax=Couchioplanes caeruleus TaxID=56438 RepID=A0A1K0GJM3_9ACTN|nr:metallophosphoesterase [Couchioplanes caeruleus]OJF09363.1 alkaline phosphatase [Couchioplanes caeruleus subsp. caeruleus]ROP27921.1 calcineurin-like phosphoesterase family protein [Couchioplanes caeruleus]
MSVHLARTVAAVVGTSRRRRVLSATIAMLVVLALVLVWLLGRCSTAPDTVRLAAVGDMACDPDDPDFVTGAGDHCKHKEASDLAVGLNPAVFLGLGDYQYELPATEAFRTVYGPTYGRLLSRTVPVIGNQEYKVQDANTFTAYFGDRFRDAKGYWSQDIGRWHLVVLNSNCSAVAGGCGKGSPQQAWLESDLAANDRACVIAAWHHPRWSTGIAGPDARTAELFRTLYDHQVELVLSGHEADYERFGPLNPDGKSDPLGVRQYVVGTGGQAHYRPASADGAGDEKGEPKLRAGIPGSEFADFDHHGVLELELRPDSWRWAFHRVGAPVTDRGEASCH